MCEVYEENPLIQVGEKTNKAKYDFLRLFYTKWNQITKPKHRIIIDTHAGTGMVELEGEKNIFNKKDCKPIYGSPLLAILKTLNISNNLTIILNEKEPERFRELEKYIKDFIDNGVPILEKEIEKFYFKSFETKRKKKMDVKPEIIFPDSPVKRVPKGFVKKRKFSTAKIIIYDKKIEDVIDEIFLTHLSSTPIPEKQSKPIALFFVDPCGMVAWKDVIEKICRRSNNEEGTELILNWSWEAINRNLPTNNKNAVLSKIYGISIDEIDEEFENITEMDQYLEKYMTRLKMYFKHVVQIGVPRDRKVKPKQSQYKKYFLLFCTNNDSALSLAGHSKKKIKTAMRGNIKSITSFLK